MPIVEVLDSDYFIKDYGGTPTQPANWNFLSEGTWAFDLANDRVFQVTENNGSFSMTSGTPVSYVNQIPSATDLVNGKNSLGTISFDAGAPSSFETYWDDGGGFRIDEVAFTFGILSFLRLGIQAILC